MATLLPFAVALSRAASSGQWRDNLSSVRDLGLVAVGLGGALSTVAAQALGLLPLGSRTFRAALGSVIALAIAAWILFRLATRLLTAAGGRCQSNAPTLLTSVLAAVATLTAALAPTWQREATVGGGAMIGACSALAAIDHAIGFRERHPSERPGARGWLGLAALLVATFCESPPAGIAASVACALALHGGGVGSRFGPPRARTGAFILGLGCALLLLAPLALRPLAPRAWADVGRTLSAASLSALDVPSANTTALAAWIREVGLVSLSIAAGGIALGLLRGRTRALMLGIVALIAIDAIAPARMAGVLSSDPLTALRSLAVAALAIGSALGVGAAVEWLRNTRVPLARSAAVLVVVFHVTLVALTSEEAGIVADRSRQLAAEAWADAALGSLEPGAAILVRSPSVAWRLWAARVTRGERPDVVIVPVPLLQRGSVGSSLMAVEPSMQWLLRDFALTGEPSEFALSKVADARTLYVELDPAWSKRLVNHLAVAGVWLEYAPQPLGPSDRKLAASATLGPMRRVLAALASADVPDASTSSVVSAALRSQADVLTLLGERESADAFVEAVAGLVESDPFVTASVLKAGIAPDGLAAIGVRSAPAPGPSARGNEARASEPRRVEPARPRAQAGRVRE